MMAAVASSMTVRSVVKMRVTQGAVRARATPTARRIRGPSGSGCGEERGHGAALAGARREAGQGLGGDREASRT